MKRRLRKKRHHGEFQELGFAVRIEVHVDDTAELDALLDRWILQAVEGNGLACGGGGAAPRWEFVVSKMRGSATEDDRTRVAAWLRTADKVAGFTVGPLMDLWHGPLCRALPRAELNGGRTE